MPLFVTWFLPRVTPSGIPPGWKNPDRTSLLVAAILRWVVSVSSTALAAGSGDRPPRGAGG
jgi:hypothetical protein